MSKMVRFVFGVILALAAAGLHAAGNLKVTLSPMAAVSAGAQWRVDSGAWQTSGATVKGLTSGSHAVDFKAINGWIAPAATRANVVNGSTASLTATYIQAASLSVTLTPATGQWKVDNGAWEASGATVQNLTPGSHTIAYAATSGYQSPPTEAVTLAAGDALTLQRSYVQYAQLTVTLSPDTAQWRIDGGAWVASGATAGNLLPGAHTIDYSSVAGYMPLASESVTLSAGQALSLARSYTQLSQLTVALTPSSAQWRVDNGSWQASGATVANLTPGSHAVDYGAVANYDAPPSETVSLVAGQTTSLSRSYTPHPASLTINLSPANAQFRVNGGAWNASGTTLGNLAAGSYTVEFSDLAGYHTPAAQTVTLNSGDTLSLNVAYVAVTPAKLTVTLTPNAAQWRVDAGVWNASGAQVDGLAPGSHVVEYSSVTGYITPSATTVTLAEAENRTLTQTYATGRATLTVNLNIGNWRVVGSPIWQQPGFPVTVTSGPVTIEYKAVAGYAAPATETITLAVNQSLTLDRSYQPQPAAVTINFNINGGSWRIYPAGTTPSDIFCSGGTMIPGLSAGAYTIDYFPVNGYVSPATETITLGATDMITLTRTYSEVANLTVSLTPSTAQWRIDGGAWIGSGATASTLTPGAHTVDYSAVANYDAPASETINLAAGQSLSLTRSYVAHPAQLTITTDPANGQWRIYPDQTTPNGSWNASGATLSGIAPGAYDIEYSSLQGYTPPAANSVVLQPGDARSISATYSPIPAELTVILSPSTGQFRVNGGAWYASGTTAKNLSAGTALVEFSNVAGYTTPASTSVTLSWGDRTTISASYVALPASLTVNADAPLAMWRLDGGGWRSVGTTVSNLTQGNHLVEGWDVHGYTTPTPLTVNLIGGQTTTVSLAYTPHPAQLTIITNPSDGQWQIYAAGGSPGTAWNASGATLTGLTAGTYTIAYTTIAGLGAPHTTSVDLAVGDSKTISVGYTALTAQINVALDQAAGHWRLDGGDWQSAGATLANLAGGDHLLEFAAVDGFSAPPSHTITLNAGDSIKYSFRYLPSAPASLRIDLVPMNGTWRVDGGAWLPSGATVGGLTEGQHALDFSDLSGRQTPYPISVYTTAGVTTEYTLTYGQVPTAGFQIFTNPASGGFRVNSWLWLPSGWSPGAETGVPTLIEYEPIPGYSTPHSEYVVHQPPADQWVTVNRTYEPSVGATVSVGLNIPIGSWRIYSGSPSGTWNTNSGTVTGLAPGTYTIEYGAVADYASPSTETVTLVDHEDLVLKRTYTTFPAQVTVNLTGVTGARWNISPSSGPTNDTWYDSGTTAVNLPPGDYTISYESVQDYVAPWSEPITLNANQVAVRTGKYHHVYDISVAVYPYTAQWRIDGGAWINSGEGVWGIAPGDHTIEYGPATGYVALAPETVTFNGQPLNLYRSYTPLAQLTVNVYPYQAQWRIDGGAWQASGATVTNLSFDVPHTIEYGPADGYVALPAETITLSSGQQQTIYRSYQPLAQLTVNVYPYVAQWRVDGGAWQTSGATVVNLAFDTPHTIDYAPTDGYVTLPSETVTLYSGQQDVLYRSYQPLAKLTVNVYPYAAQWRVDGGAWQASGATVANLAFDTPHTIEYAPTDGYVTLPSETVTLSSGQETILYRSYQALAAVTVNVYPNEGQWRVDGGTWQLSGATVRNLSIETPHRIEFLPIRGQGTPLPQVVLLHTGDQPTLYASYLNLGSHALRFFVSPELAGSLSPVELQNRLSQYAAHLIGIFTRETQRVITFDPQTGITVTSTDPFTGPESTPQADFELWVHATLTDDPAAGSYGGVVGADSTGAGGIHGMKWDQIYDPSAVADGSIELRQYWRQLHLTLRGLEQAFGAGIPDYATLGGLHDLSGVAPLLSDVPAADSSDTGWFWEDRFNYWTDPLTANAYANPRLGSPTSLSTLLNLVSFAPATRGIINGGYRGADNAAQALPDMTRTMIQVLDAQTGTPVNGAIVRVWNRQDPASPTSTYEETVSDLGVNGFYSFSWTGAYGPVSEANNAKLVKVYAAGYAATAQWVTIYDAQTARLADGSSSLTVLVTLTPQ